jgi:endonuclease-3
MILWENIAYLADDAKRAKAWAALRQRVGTTPEEVLAAPRGKLLAIARAGILAADRVEKMREIARMAIEEFGGRLERALDGTVAEAKKALKKFPSIGDPGAEKILLFSRRDPVLALDSNGLRVLLRIGYGEQDKSYARSYASVREASRPEWKGGFDWLIAAHRVARQRRAKSRRR